MNVTNIKDRIEFTNIHKYKVDDVACENLLLKASICKISKVIVGPSTMPTIQSVLHSCNVPVAVSISYPSGAYFPDAKVEEIEEIINLYPDIDSFYVVMAVGRFLSGYEAEAVQEMKTIVEAAKGKEVYIMTESAALDENQRAKLCDMAVEAKVSGIVVSTGFAPYDVPFPIADDIKKFVTIAKGRIKIIANGSIDTLEKAQEILSSGADKVIVSNIDFLE